MPEFASALKPGWPHSFCVDYSTFDAFCRHLDTHHLLFAGHKGDRCPDTMKDERKLLFFFFFFFFFLFGLSVYVFHCFSLSLFVCLSLFQCLSLALSLFSLTVSFPFLSSSFSDVILCG